MVHSIARIDCPSKPFALFPAGGISRNDAVQPTAEEFSLGET